MADFAPCPKCDCAYVYEDGALLVCPECAHEWNPDMAASDERVYKDVNGNVLVEGDICLLYTSPSPRDATLSRMPSSA